MDEISKRLDEQITCFRKKVDEKNGTRPMFTTENVLWILEEIRGGKKGEFKMDELEWVRRRDKICRSIQVAHNMINRFRDELIELDEEFNREHETAEEEG